MADTSTTTTFPLLREFTNVTAHDAEGVCVFYGKRAQDAPAAELLNQLCADGQLFRRPEGVKARRCGFYAIAHDDPEALPDLREVTAHPNPFLVGPGLRPPVFLRQRARAARERWAQLDGFGEDHSGFANNAGFIYDTLKHGPSGNR
jgi:hypothetical protein